MATIDCESCQDFKEYAPEYIQNGLSDAMCTSLQNDTGLKANSGHDDCEDLNTINDCTIGAMDDRIETFEACEWREYMHEFVQNLYNLLKSIICAICGIWTNIHSLWTAINSIDTHEERIDCIIQHLTQDRTMHIPVEYVRFNSEVSNGSSGTSIAIEANAYLAYYTGQVEVSQNFVTKCNNEKVGNGDLPRGGFLLYEYNIPKEEFNIRKIFPASMQVGNRGDCLLAHVWIYTEGETTMPDWGVYSSDTTGQHVVPDGIICVQVRLNYAEDFTVTSFTMCGSGGILFNPDKFEC